jgi:hypothetical protein
MREKAGIEQTKMTTSVTLNFIAPGVHRLDPVMVVTVVITHYCS